MRIDTRNSKLRDAIYESGLASKEIARLAGLHAVTLSNLVHGAWEPKDATVRKLCEVLDKTPFELGFSDVPAEEKIITDPAAVAKKIVEALSSGFKTASSLYKSFVLSGGDSAELRRHSNMSGELWQILDDVAFDRLTIEAAPLPVMTRKIIRTMPLEKQVEVLAKGVDVPSDRDGSAVRKQIIDLPLNEIRQAISKAGTVRTVEEQKVWLSVKRMPVKRNRDGQLVWEIKNHKLIVYLPCEFTRTDWKRIYIAME